MEGRIPPHSIDAEKSVLGAALLSKDALFDVVEVTRPEDFYDENHKEIFRAILDLHRRNAPVDALTVSEELKKRNSLNMVGGRAYIASLSAATPATSNAMEYAKIVAEMATVRRIIQTADDIVVKGYDGSMDEMCIRDRWRTPSPQQIAIFLLPADSFSFFSASYSLFLYSCSPMTMQIRLTERPSFFSISSSREMISRFSSSAIFSAVCITGAPKKPVTNTMVFFIIDFLS